MTPNLSRFLQERMRDEGHQVGEVTDDWGQLEQTAWLAYAAGRGLPIVNQPDLHHLSDELRLRFLQENPGALETSQTVVVNRPRLETVEAASTVGVEAAAPEPGQEEKPAVHKQPDQRGRRPRRSRG